MESEDTRTGYSGTCLTSIRAGARMGCRWQVAMGSVIRKVGDLVIHARMEDRGGSIESRRDEPPVPQFKRHSRDSFAVVHVVLSGGFNREFARSDGQASLNEPEAGHVGIFVNAVPNVFESEFRKFGFRCDLFDQTA